MLKKILYSYLVRYWWEGHKCIGFDKRQQRTSPKWRIHEKEEENKVRNYKYNIKCDESMYESEWNLIYQWEIYSTLLFLIRVLNKEHRNLWNKGDRNCNSRTTFEG